MSFFFCIEQNFKSYKRSKIDEKFFTNFALFLLFYRERIVIDKTKLLEIARRNAINLIMKGKLPLAQQDKAIAAIQAGGKTIEELTGTTVF